MKGAKKKEPRGFKRQAIRKGFLEEVVCELDGVSPRNRKMQQSLYTQVVKQG